jgi:hypothetical protein
VKIFSALPEPKEGLSPVIHIKRISREGAKTLRKLKGIVLNIPFAPSRLRVKIFSDWAEWGLSLANGEEDLTRSHEAAKKY